MNLEVEEIYEFITGIENMNVDSLFDSLNAEDKRNLMYKFFIKDSKIQELCDEIELKKEDDEEKYNKFIENIILMYPLTRKLIKELNERELKVNKKSVPALLQSPNYVNSFYNSVLKDINLLLKEVEGNTALQKLKTDILKLEEEIKIYNEQIEEMKNLENNKSLSKIAERDRLKKELDDFNIEKLEEEIQALSSELSMKKEKEKNKLAEKNKLVEELKKIDLSRIEKDEKNAIEVLMKIWSKDESGN